MNYFDSNRTNTVILKFEAVKCTLTASNFKITVTGSGYSINLLQNFKNGKIGN